MKNSFLPNLKTKAKDAGWRIEQTTGNHWQFFSPDGKTIIVVAGTPSDWRAQRKVAAQFKRVGLEV